jgi:DNA-binding NtrC family response regulator
VADLDLLLYIMRDVSVISPENKRVLVVDEDTALRERTQGILSRAGYPVSTAATLVEALAHLDRRHHDAVILQLTREHAAALGAVREHAPGTPVLVLASPERLHDAVVALREGAEDYVQRPADPFELRTRLERILERFDLGSRIALLQDEVSRHHGFKHLVAHSTAMKAVLERIARVAPMRATVLVHGESGVGKELVARAIHFNSSRREQPFIAINCAAIAANLIESELFGHERGSFTGAHARTRGKFEMAHRGTLFLDEIGEMDPASQSKLLRVLEEKEFMRVGGDHSIRVDVRVIAATNAELEKMVERGAFRRDLYYRLKVVTIPVPPLRDRRSDIPPLVEAFLDELARANAVPRKAIDPAALEALTEYAWPGNVRELKNVLESVLVSSAGDWIRPEDLPPAIVREAPGAERAELAPGMKLADAEAILIRRTLEHTGGNRTHSAHLLGIGVRTLQRKIRELALEIPSKRRRPRRPGGAS